MLNRGLNASIGDDSPLVASPFVHQYDLGVMSPAPPGNTMLFLDMQDMDYLDFDFMQYLGA